MLRCRSSCRPARQHPRGLRNPAELHEKFRWPLARTDAQTDRQTHAHTRTHTHLSSLLRQVPSSRHCLSLPLVFPLVVPLVVPLGVRWRLKPLHIRFSFILRTLYLLWLLLGLLRASDAPRSSVGSVRSYQSQ